jgi:hypothetical protein
MNVWLAAATACCAAGLAVQALDVRAKLRFALIVAQWGALFWIGLRVAAFAAGATTT